MRNEGDAFPARFQSSHFLENGKEFFAVTGTLYLFGDIQQPPFSCAALDKLDADYPKTGGYLPFNEAGENSGPLSVQKAAAISSDPAFEDLAHRVGVQNLLGVVKKFGVGQNPFNSTASNDLTELYDQFGQNSHASTAGLGGHFPGRG